VKLLLVALLGGLLLGWVAGTPAQAQSSGTPLPPEVRDWARLAVDQLGVAIRVAVFALNVPALSDIQLQAERVLNTLVGKQNPDYLPRAGDPPGSDGVGVLSYLSRMREAIESRAQANERLRPLLFALSSIGVYLQEALQRVAEIRRTREEAQARRSLNQLLAFLVAARGSREDPPSEGGARALLMQLGGP
jgi:hypothetical protein